MRLRQLLAVAVTACLLAVSCGSPKTFDVTVKPVERMKHSQRFVNAVAAADAAALKQRRDLFTFVGAYRAPEPVREQPVSVTPEPSMLIHQRMTDAPADIWSCIAEAETGSDWSMHGSTYSTAFGMVNDIIYEYGTPEEQQAVFSGTASPETQIRIASAFAADHGFGGWGELTKQKCGL